MMKVLLASNAVSWDSQYSVYIPRQIQADGGKWKEGKKKIN